MITVELDHRHFNKTVIMHDRHPAHCHGVQTPYYRMLRVTRIPNVLLLFDE